MSHWMNEHNRPAVEAAIAASAMPAVRLPPGEHEIRLGIEGAVDGVYVSAGMHGTLRIGKRHRPPEELLTAALALLIGAIPDDQRAKLLRDLPRLAHAGDLDSLAHVGDARKLLAKLRSRTHVEWIDTPTYKPRR